MTIYENYPADARDTVIDNTREAHAKIKEQHRVLTGEEDLALVALMVMVGIGWSDECSCPSNRRRAHDDPYQHHRDRNCVEQRCEVWQLA